MAAATVEMMPQLQLLSARPMNFVCAKHAALAATQRDALMTYRHRVFVERLGWSLPGEPGHERDQFDHDETVHAIVLDDKGGITGCGRLLPSTGPYLLESVFPHLLNGLPTPRHDAVWELSRFAVMSTDRTQERRRFAAERLLLRVMQYCAERGVATLLAVTTLPVERLMQRAGVQMHRLGPPDVEGPEVIVGLALQIDDVSLRALARFEEIASRGEQPAVARQQAQEALAA